MVFQILHSQNKFLYLEIDEIGDLAYNYSTYVEITSDTACIKSNTGIKKPFKPPGMFCCTVLYLQISN